MEAARTCSRLLTPSIHLISGHAHVVSQTAVQVVADVLSKLLVVGITDPGKSQGRALLGILELEVFAWSLEVNTSRFMVSHFSAKALGLAPPVCGVR